MRAVLVTCLGDSRLAQEPLESALQYRIMEYIRAHLAEHYLSAARIACTHHISVRPGPTHRPSPRGRQFDTAGHSPLPAQTVREQSAGAIWRTTRIAARSPQWRTDGVSPAPRISARCSGPPSGYPPRMARRQRLGAVHAVTQAPRCLSPVLVLSQATFRAFLDKVHPPRGFRVIRRKSAPAANVEG